MTPDPVSDFALAAKAAVAELDAYLRSAIAGEGPVVRLRPLREIAEGLDLERWIRRGGLGGAVYRDFLASYLETTTRLPHPGYMAHQVAVPLPQAGLAGLVDAVTNNPMAIYEMGQGASAMEFTVLNWMLQKLGFATMPWPGEGVPAAERGGGVLTHGGSLANLTALLAARARVAPELWRSGGHGGLAILVSPNAHYAIGRAAGIMGLGLDGMETVAVDARGVIDPAGLEAALERLRGRGRRPLCLVANACSTAVGLYDPLPELADFCERHGIWLHVDAAHGASALLSRDTRHLLDGVERADSVVWDTHKMLQTPALCAALLVRRAADLDRTFQQEASYLIHDKHQPGIDFLHRTLECTKAGLGLKVFTVLAAAGEAAMGEHVAACYRLAHRAWELVGERAGFEAPVQPQANILCFRHGEDDALQLRIRDRLLAEGRFHLSSTVYRGARYLRCVFMSPNTDESIVEAMLDAIEAAAASDG